MTGCITRSDSYLEEIVPLLLDEGVVLDGDRVPHVVLRRLRVLHLPLAVVAASQGAATVQLRISL